MHIEYMLVSIIINGTLVCTDIPSLWEVIQIITMLLSYIAPIQLLRLSE
jgi:hypothetical protein